MTGVKEIKPRGINVSYSNKQQEIVASGERFGESAYIFPGQRMNEKGEKVGVPELKYPVVDIPAVYDEVPDPDNPGQTKRVLVTPKREGQTFDFGGKSFDVSPEADAGFMVFGQSQEASDAGLNPGFSRSGQNISFVPKSITFKPTANQEVKVEVDGTMQTFAKGEPLDQAAIDALSEEQREKVLTTKPWLEGTEENGMTLSIAFSPNVHRRFSTHVSFESKRNRAVYERIMRAIGEEPIKKR